MRAQAVDCVIIQADDADHDVMREVLTHAPLPARLILPVLAPRLYASHAKKVYGTRTPPRVGR